MCCKCCNAPIGGNHAEWCKEHKTLDDYCREILQPMINNLKVNKETKMTREEAINKTGGAQNLVNALEALGLIKFEKLEYKDSPSMIISSQLVNCNQPMLKAQSIINELMKFGYKIVDTSICEIIDPREEQS